MPVLIGPEFEREYVIETAKLLIASARTAPKSAGFDDILIALVTGEEKEDLAKAMEEIGAEHDREDKLNWVRDAQNTENSDAIIIVGVRGTKSLDVGLNCGGCGYSGCKVFSGAEKKQGLDFMGPNCIFKILDLGIALGSVVKMASLLNLDNRIMYKIGAAAMRCQILPQADIIMGIPVSARGKNIYFDRRKMFRYSD